MLINSILHIDLFDVKYKFNFSAFFLAIVVFFATNGFFVFEHICNSSNTQNFSILKKTICEMEKPLASCCLKVGIKPKKNCCEHKFFFSKLATFFILEKKTSIQDSKRIIKITYSDNVYLCYKNVVSEGCYSGLSPPNNFFEIKLNLKPTQSKLQTYLC